MIAFPRRQWIYNLVIIRLLRVFKFFKLSYGLQVLLHTLKASSYELTLLLLVLLIPLVVFSSLVYAFEHGMTDGKTDFDSIPRTFWWAIVTMTTVGYGDLAPKTWVGQLIGSICAIISVLIIALPISVIGNNFNLYYAHVRARLKLPKKNRTLLQGRLRGLLRQPAMLSSRDRDRKNITRRNNAHNLPINLGDGSKLTVDHAHTPSPFIQLRRRGGAGLDQISVDSNSTDKTQSESCKQSNQSSGDCATSLSKEVGVMHKKDSLISTSLSVLGDDYSKNELQNNTILQNFLLHSNETERSRSPPMRQIINENDTGRKRKRHIQEHIMNGFPTRARRAAVGTTMVNSLDDSLSQSSLGSSDSLILPPVTQKSPRSVTENNKIVSNITKDNPARRESMKKMKSFENNELSSPPLERRRSLSNAAYVQADLSRSSTFESNLSRRPSTKTDSTLDGNSVSSSDATPLIPNTIDSENRNINGLGNTCGTEKEKLFPFAKRNMRTLQRSNTEHSFLSCKSQELKTNLNKHSWSIDDILRNKTYQNGSDKTALFLKESGV